MGYKEETKWKSIVAILIFLILLILIGLNSSPISFNPDKGEFEYHSSPQSTRPLP